MQICLASKGSDPLPAGSSSHSAQRYSDVAKWYRARAVVTCLPTDSSRHAWPRLQNNVWLWRAMVFLGVITAHGMLAMALPGRFEVAPQQENPSVGVQSQPLSIAMQAQSSPVNDSHLRVRAVPHKATVLPTASANVAMAHRATKPKRIALNRTATSAARSNMAQHSKAAPTSTAMAAANMPSTPAAIHSGQGRAATPTQSQARFDADYLHNPTPVYPAFSLRLREEGRVLLKVWVTAQGVAKQVLMARSSGYTRLDEAALVAVRQWRFVPARSGEEPMDSWVLVPVQFSLRGEA